MMDQERPTAMDAVDQVANAYADGYEAAVIRVEELARGVNGDDPARSRSLINLARLLRSCSPGRPPQILEASNV